MYTIHIVSLNLAREPGIKQLTAKLIIAYYLFIYIYETIKLCLTSIC